MAALDNLHIYTRKLEPATCFDVGAPAGRSHVIRLGPRCNVWTDCCRQRRQARYVCAQVFYDDLRMWCMTGHGCRKVPRRKVSR